MRLAFIVALALKAKNQFKARYNQHGNVCGCLVYEAHDREKILFADDIQRVEIEIANQIQNSEDSLNRVKYRILRKDGAVRMVDDIGRKVFTENGGSDETGKAVIKQSLERKNV